MTEPSIIEIDPKKKYVLSVSAPITELDAEVIKAKIRIWLADEEMPFLILGAGVSLVKIEQPAEVEIRGVSPMMADLLGLK